MPIILEKVNHYPNGGRLLIFSTGRVKYLPSKEYTSACNTLHIEKANRKAKKGSFIKKPNIQEECNRFFNKIFEEAKKKKPPKVDIDTTVQVRT